MALPFWKRLILLLALAKIGVAVALAFGLGIVRIPPAPVFVAIIAVFGASAVWLQVLGRGDTRAVNLGIYFLLTATAFADPILTRAADREGLSSWLPQVVGVSQVDALLPFFFWLFVAEFPRTDPPERARRIVRTGIYVTGLLGAGLWLWNLGAAIFPRSSHSGLVAVLAHDGSNSLYWRVILLATAAGLLLALGRAGDAPVDERRRVRLTIAGIVLGSFPLLIVLLIAYVVPSFMRYLEEGGVRTVGYALVYPALISIPLSTAYAVLVHRALDVRLIARRVMQYAFARSGIAVTGALPFALVIGVIYARRDQSVEALLSGPAGALAAAGILAGAGMQRIQPRLLDSLDRRFFREQYDARQILASLVEDVRAVQRREELAAVVVQGVDRALHLRFVQLLLLHAPTGNFVAPLGGLPPLAVGTRLARLLERAPDPLEIDPERPERWMEALPDAERRWLVNGDVRLLVPIASTHGSLLGVLVLGEKWSELPFTGEDRVMLSAIAGSAALPLEHRLRVGGARRPEALDEAGPEALARECLGCGAIGPADERRCGRCGDSTSEAGIPLVLEGKFRFLERAGRGGMGVVYRALDLTLDREVAVKTLPRVGADEARRLRAEARTMAAVSHPNLATILGAESWNGVPMLVVEFLPGGTLQDRLRAGPLTLPEAWEIAGALLPALALLHESGIFHRDVKPSNIGFTARGAPKLLDFGLARVLDVAQSAPLAGEGSAARGDTRGSGLAGTPLYLSPEAIAGERPRASFDLWAMSVVLYESIAGVNPFDGGSVEETFRRITGAQAPDIREYRPEVPAKVAAFFTDSLASDRGRRPTTAMQYLEALRTAFEPPPARPPTAIST